MNPISMALLRFGYSIIARSESYKILLARSKDIEAQNARLSDMILDQNQKIIRLQVASNKMAETCEAIVNVVSWFSAVDSTAKMAERALENYNRVIEDL